MLASCRRAPGTERVVSLEAVAESPKALPPPVPTGEQLGVELPRWTLKEAISCVGSGTWGLKRELFSKLVQVADHAEQTPLGAFPASSPMVAVHGQGINPWPAVWRQCGGRWEVARWQGVADRTGVPECRPTVFSGLTARDRGLGTGILAHEAVGSPGGSHLPLPP